MGKEMNSDTENPMICQPRKHRMFWKFIKACVTCGLIRTNLQGTEEYNKIGDLGVIFESYFSFAIVNLWENLFRLVFNIFPYSRIFPVLPHPHPLSAMDLSAKTHCVLNTAAAKADLWNVSQITSLLLWEPSIGLVKKKTMLKWPNFCTKSNLHFPLILFLLLYLRHSGLLLISW